MAGDTNNPIDPNFSKQIDIESLISAPLIAASKANVIMVTGQTRFLLDYCFKKKANDSATNDSYEPVMIEMVMTRSIVDEEKVEGSDADGREPTYIKRMKSIDLSFSVPLLCLVPLNSLAINKVNLGFDLEITSASSWEYNSESEPGGKTITRKGAQLTGKISYDHEQNSPDGKGQYKSSMSSKLKVNIDAGPLPLPVGVLSIIDLYNKSIQPISLDKGDKK